MDHATFTAALDVLAPLRLAAPWDNVGWIVDPPRGARVRRVLVTLDLTDAVLDEAVAAKADTIVAYHPPVFASVKKLTHSDAVTSRVLRAAAARIGVYSPHTALDAVDGGVNDWLVDGVGPGTKRSLEPARTLRPTEQVKIVVFVPATHVDVLREAMSSAGAGFIGAYTHCSFATTGTGSFFGTEGTNPVVGTKGQLEFAPEVKLEMVAPEAALPVIADAIRTTHPYEEPAWEVVRLIAKAELGTGQGRIVTLERAVAASTVIARVKKHLKLARVFVALAPRHANGEAIATVAVCAGAGASVVAASDADLLLTGEMRHHDVLAALDRGSSVIVAGHAETERPYLPLFVDKLADAVGKSVAVTLAKSDAGPLSPM